MALSEECQRFMSGEAQDATPSSSSFSLTIETEESDDNVLPTATLFSALTPLIRPAFQPKLLSTHAVPLIRQLLARARARTLALLPHSHTAPPPWPALHPPQ